MKEFENNKIKNLAILGHANSGKTTLCDALIYLTGESDRIGSSEDGTLILDFDAEEKKRHVSLASAVYPVTFNDYKINLIDSPGLFDFMAGSREAITAGDSALIVVSGKSGLTVGAEQSVELCEKLNKPLAFFISKLDAPRAMFYRVLSIITGKYGSKVCPIIVPHEKGDEVDCFVDLITGKAYTYNGKNKTEVPFETNDNIEAMRSLMLEAVASQSDELMEKYFGGETFTPEEIIGALRSGYIKGDLYPVFCGIASNGSAVESTFSVLTQIMPSLSDVSVTAEKGDDLTEIKVTDSETVIECFKTIADPFVGKLSYFKVFSGAAVNDQKLINATTGEEVKLSKVLTVKGPKQEDAGKVPAGDIGAALKVMGIGTGDTLSVSGKIKLEKPDFPLPTLAMAVYPKNKGEEEKISTGLKRLMEEDPTINFYANAETKETILEGLGEQHIDVIVSKLKSKFSVEVVLKAPKVAYRETIKKFCKVQGRHKKQSGGHGQFGDVWIEFSPCSEDFIFEEKIFGGSVPKNFHPAVEKGLRECMQKGVLAGFPVVGVKAVLVDGSYHPVDSSEMSFKMAAAEAFKAGIKDAAPVLLEPIGTLTALVPDDFLGDVIGDVNKRRGRVIGMDPKENKMQEVTAEVPQSEMSDFSTAMRSITGGRASFKFEFARYEEAPAAVANKIIEENKE